jgi:hypothetical protein
MLCDIDKAPKEEGYALAADTYYLDSVTTDSDNHDSATT